MIMTNPRNEVVKKYLVRIVNELVKKKKYSKLTKVEVFFLFGFTTKTAMCDWIYGLKIHTKLDYSLSNKAINDLKGDIKKVFEHFFEQSICCTDIIIEKN